MTIFNDSTKTPDEEAEMNELKAGVQKAKDRIREGREMPIADAVDKAKAKAKPKGKQK